MVDTVRMKLPVILTTTTTPQGWEQSGTFKEIATTLDGLLERRVGLGFQHSESGLRIGGRAPFLDNLEVSLPRLLHGHNGMLIASEQELIDAFVRIDSLVSQLGQPQWECVEFRRVDFAWHFRGRFADYANAYRDAKFRRVRRPAGGYEDESIFWKGRSLHLRIYDKVRQVTKKSQPGNVVRVELQIRNPKLRELLGDGERVTDLRFDRCYAVFRSLLQGFTPTTVPSVSNIADIFVMADIEGCRPHGMSLFQHWAQTRSPRQVSRMRQQMAAVRLKYFKHDFATLLPENGLPPIVEVNEYGIELPPRGSRPCAEGEPTAAEPAALTSTELHTH